MGHKLRHLLRSEPLVEVTVRTLQGRFLLRPGRRLNEIFVGVLGRSQSLYPVVLHSVSCASNHFHILLTPPDSQELACFMNHLLTNLSKEIGQLYDWPGTVFSRRYSAIEISDEKEKQVARLKYVTSHGCKEGVVLSPGDWPGVHSADALLTGEPLRGYWFSRTKERNARMRGEDFGRLDYATAMEVRFEPLPCWQHLPPAEVRRRVADLISEIEAETLAMHGRRGTVPAGARAARKMHPHYRPEKTKKSPAPRFHAFRKKVRKRLEHAYACFVVEYREAAERLRAGDRDVRFPEDCFPPRLPFVPRTESFVPG